MPELPLAIIYSILAYGPMVICDTMARNDPSRSTGGGGYGASFSKERNAFFALRSCHQILRGDTGEFFSPDYLCSNPPLWCNWTIQVPAGKHVHLVLEDFTPADACHLKTDQIHVDEAPSTGSGTGSGGGSGVVSDGGLAPGGDHRILEKCWRKAEYVSLSETVHVVLLISRTPNPPLRGFYGTFKAIGGVPSSGTGTVEAPGNENMYREEEQEGDEKLEPSSDRNKQHHSSENENELPVATPRSKAKPSTSSSGKVDHPSAAHSNELISEQGHEESQGHGQGHGAEKGKVKWENVRGPSEGAVPGGGGGRERGGGGGGGGESKAGEVLAPDMSSSTKPGNKKKKGQRLHGDDPSSVTPAKDTDSRLKPTKGHIDRLEKEEDDEEYVVVTRSPQSLVSVTMTTARRDVVEEDHDSSSVPEPKVEAARRPGTIDNNIRERAAPHLTPRNGSHHLHLPGASLFEVSLEVSFSHQPGENWDQLVSSLLAPAKAMVKEQLVRYAPKTISSKRIKRLSSGALFLFWVHFGEGQDGPQTRGGFHATVEGLKGRSLLPQGEGTEGVISYVTVSDVNECGTQLSQCDAHAECVNRFGSYACRCRHGYLDMSRSGPGGTVCIDSSSTGCSLSPPALLKGVYGVCFLLGLLLFSMLLALVAMWRRHHQGAFTLHCQGRCPSHSSGLTGVATPPAGCCGGNHRFCCCEGSGRRGGCMNAEKPLPPPPPPPPMGRCAKDGGCGKGKGNDPPLLRYGPLTGTEGEATEEEGWGGSDIRADHCTV